MLKVEIRRPNLEDTKELHLFFKTVITDTFMKEGLADRQKDIKDEIEAKEKYLASDFESNGDHRYFLIALDGDKIIGSIEFGPASDLICNCTNNAFKGLIEVGTVFVHPDFQRMGVGNLLLNAMYITMKKKGIEVFCLDSGYTRAQKIWIKKFGEPTYLLKDYWGTGNDHMIWRIKVSELSGDLG
ncbi:MULTISPECIES: GNAT family N-acetyltransferase [Neobacillus]|uniref:GNAT family N-acetyltransferase n=1 Tax=Neobacillus rhizophilus TaxID=2833579 RepID=A0A942U3F6_9BACI|nr:MULTISPECIES: GNAT family N-acetyltransferase [Neobacillus]MBS4213966.1 GNAT family N-acetyltransferase [Neobacillus rhizophilus]MBU8917629.1 GNAT family N-acetyltransferase [Bacillus sp. FJAT-29953]